MWWFLGEVLYVDSQKSSKLSSQTPRHYSVTNLSMGNEIQER